MLTALGSRAQFKVYPPYWYRGLQNDSLEILLHSEEEMKRPPEVQDGIKLLEASLAPNPHWAYIRILAPQSAPDTFHIEVGGQKLTYELRGRSTYQPKGISPEDAICKIAAGDLVRGQIQVQDSVKNEKGSSADPFLLRIIDHMPQVRETGFTAIWTPSLLESDSGSSRNIKNHYTTAARLGNDELYERLGNELHDEDMKLVRDLAFTHLSPRHPLALDPPGSGFVKWEADTPLVRQDNPHMALYLVQSAVWSVEEYGIDAFHFESCIDVNLLKMLGRRLEEEFEDILLLGPPCRDVQKLPQFLARESLEDHIRHWEADSAESLVRVVVLGKQYLDHRQQGRKVEADSLKLALGMLFSLHGIPAMSTAALRGGMSELSRPGDTSEIMDFLDQLLNWRKHNNPVQEGKLKSFVVDDGVYAYFRHTDDGEKVMVLANTTRQRQQIKLARFSEIWPPSTPAIDIITRQKLSEVSIELEPTSILIAEKVRESKY